MLQIFPVRGPPARSTGARAPLAVPPVSPLTVRRWSRGIPWASMPSKSAPAYAAASRPMACCVRAHCPKGSAPGGFPRQPGDQEAPLVTSHRLLYPQAGQGRATGQARAAAPPVVDAGEQLSLGRRCFRILGCHCAAHLVDVRQAVPGVEPRLILNRHEPALWMESDAHPRFRLQAIPEIHPPPQPSPTGAEKSARLAVARRPAWPMPPDRRA